MVKGDLGGTLIPWDARQQFDQVKNLGHQKFFLIA
jgi:hypothetical protein